MKKRNFDILRGNFDEIEKTDKFYDSIHMDLFSCFFILRALQAARKKLSSACINALFFLLFLC